MYAQTTTTQAVGTETRHYETHDWAKVRGSYKFSHKLRHTNQWGEREEKKLNKNPFLYFCQRTFV